MKNTRIIAVVAVLFLLAVVFTACEFGPAECEHEWLEATCTEPKTCNICAETEGDPLGHTEETVAGKAATCTEAGLTDGKKCSACDEVLLAQETIPALGHKDEDSDYVCDVCKAELCTNHVPSDAVKENEVASTCSKEGSYELVVRCSNCNEELSRETVAVEKLDHTTGETTRENEVAPTCDSKGSYEEVVKCSVCSEEISRKTVEIDALGHKEGEATRENEVAPTCTKNGSYDEVVKCSVCEKELRRETKSVDMLPHTEEAVEGKAATCTETGLTEGKKCSVCGETLLAQEVISALGHKDEDSDYKCDACGEALCTNHTEEIIPGTPATCTEGGITDGKKCSKCGEILQEQHSIEALGHNYEAASYVWSEDNFTCTATATCANDASHVLSESVTANAVELSVSATKVVFTYKVAFENAKFEAQEHTVEADVELVNSIATINAPALEGRVPSHDYVKFGFHDAEATYTFTIYYSEVDVWDGTSVSASLSGAGTAEDPYLIQSGADLAYVAKVVNDAAAATANFKGMYFKMTKSIDLSGNELKIGGYSSGKIFHGFFDGNNCSIRGIKATQSLFGQLKDGYIKNLSTYGTVTTTEKKGVAGLVSYMTGATVENITNYVDVTGVQQVAGVVGWLENNTTSIAKNCVNYGNVVATSYQIGGIAGFAKGTLTDCVNFGDVTSSASGYVGGIGGAAKDAKGSRSNCVNYGNISAKSYIGGCFGQINKTTTDCYSYGTVKLVSGSDANIGEVVGSGASYLTYTAE